MRGYLGAAVFFLVSAQAQAHIVPPEQFHPTVESYRRAMFLLNLNPVIWDQVKTDTDRVAMGGIGNSFQRARQRLQTGRFRRHLQNHRAVNQRIALIYQQFPSCRAAKRIRKNVARRIQRRLIPLLNSLHLNQR